MSAADRLISADRLTALRATIDQQGIIDPNRETHITRETVECLQDLDQRVSELERFVVSRLPTCDPPLPGEVVRDVMAYQFADSQPLRRGPGRPPKNRESD